MAEERTASGPVPPSVRCAASTASAGAAPHLDVPSDDEPVGRREAGPRRARPAWRPSRRARPRSALERAASGATVGDPPHAAPPAGLPCLPCPLARSRSGIHRRSPVRRSGARATASSAQRAARRSRGTRACSAARAPEPAAAARGRSGRPRRRCPAAGPTAAGGGRCRRRRRSAARCTTGPGRRCGRSSSPASPLPRRRSRATPPRTRAPGARRDARPPASAGRPCRWR